MGLNHESTRMVKHEKDRMISFFFVASSFRAFVIFLSQ
jgi:hypothetical protein